MIRSLERLLRPRSIAVFGGREAARVVEQCDKMGFAGAIWPVHPSLDAVHGRLCFRRVEDLPAAPDAAFVGVNRARTVEIVAALAAAGAGGAVCYASGFKEAAGELADGAKLQAALVAAAGAMPIVGPNCYGFVNALDGALLWPDQHGLQREARGVALVTQSSNIALNLSMQARGLPIAYLMTAGNQAQTGLSGLALGALEDPRVTALGLHVEGIDGLRPFEALAARARALRKPVVVLKAGRSEAARTAALSHTASLAGADGAADALFRHLGMARLRSLPELVEALKLLHLLGPLASREIASMSCSGGEASLIADLAEGRALIFRPFEPDARARLKAVLGPLVTVANPLDYHTFIWADRARMAAAFEAVLAGGFGLALLILDFPRADRCDGADWDLAVAALAEARARTGAAAAIVASLPENLPEPRARSLVAAGLVPLQGLDEALAAAEAAAAIGAAWAAPAPAALLDPGPEPAGPAVLLDEAAAKQALAAHGLAVPAGAVAHDAAEAAAAAVRLGWPVALKALGVAHKTEAGAVRLGLRDAAAVETAAAALLPLGAGLLVERMVEDGVAELILGVARQPPHGLMLSLGAGGVLVELLQDAALLPLPTTAERVRAALLGLRAAPLLQGFRGRPAADLDAAVAAALAVARYAEANAARLLELDVNPLILRPAGRGAIAVDALIRLRGG
jgi:acetyl-CoA synthetase